MAGLKSLAQELQSKGRNGDTILAHINPQEAAMLKAAGGAGTINPHTGLPEYFSLGNVFRPVTRAWKAVTNLPVIKQVSDVVTPALQAVAPYAQYIAPFIPGVGPLMAAGLGALGSGFAGKGGFNFKRGLMGGLTAYGLGNLYAGLQAAGGSLPGASTAAGGTAPATSSAAEMANVALAEGAPTAGMVSTQPSIGAQVMGGDFSGAASQIGDRLSTMGTDFTNQMSSAGQGIKNLVGVGEQTIPLGESVTGSKAAMASLGKEFGTGSATALGMGVMGTAALDEEQKYLDQQKAAGTITDDEYNRQMAIIADGRRRAEEAVRANPYQFAGGGSVDDSYGYDDAVGAKVGNMNQGLFSLNRYAPMQYAAGGLAAFNQGGQPRFLSGGGDGMSDSIPATIGENRPARLADGEFVIPADVVSNLGNGSSKAGAKRLYGMMDRVRKARTGTTKQAKAINPAKVMPA